MAFDPLNLLLLAIAIIVFWRLRSVLGSRTGNERPPFDPYSLGRKRDNSAGAEPANGNLIRFPKDEGEEATVQDSGGDATLPVWTGFADAGTATAKGLEQIALADANFTPMNFVERAKVAYEMIIDAFARGDKPTLKPLLSRDVYDGFSKVIDQRNAAGQKIESRFVGIDKAIIAAADLNGKKASLTIRFVSQLISAVLSKDEEIVDGDPKQIREVTDVWTFERDVASRDPTWTLAATQEQG